MSPTPTDPAAVAQFLSDVEIGQRLDDGNPQAPTTKRLIATCRALLAELALSRAAVEVAEAADKLDASLAATGGGYTTPYNVALARYRAAKAGAGKLEQEQR